MHKGFAFVQFTGPFDARSACLGEDGKTICGQVRVVQAKWGTLLVSGGDTEGPECIRT